MAMFCELSQNGIDMSSVCLQQLLVVSIRNLDRITCRSIEEGTASIGILVQLVGRFKGRCLSTAKQAVIVTTAIDL